VSVLDRESSAVSDRAPAAVAGRSRASLDWPLTVRRLGRSDYAVAYRAMRAFTAARADSTPDEVWLTEHPPVYTLGQAGRPEHLLRANGIPVVRTDRGGQITHHGPGQAVLYALLDLRRGGLGVKRLVELFEQATIDVLAAHGVPGERRPGAPGVYVSGAKIAALGLRVRDGRCYHGLALNVDMDLAPFADINPCGYAGLSVTQLADHGVRLAPAQAGEQLAARLAALLAARD
jgi:lipoyl(octanoyl) transferase